MIFFLLRSALSCVPLPEEPVLRLENQSAALTNRVQSLFKILGFFNKEIVLQNENLHILFDQLLNQDLFIFLNKESKKKNKSADWYNFFNIFKFMKIIAEYANYSKGTGKPVPTEEIFFVWHRIKSDLPDQFLLDLLPKDQVDDKFLIEVLDSCLDILISGFYHKIIKEDLGFCNFERVGPIVNWFDIVNEIAFRFKVAPTIRYRKLNHYLEMLVISRACKDVIKSMRNKIDSKLNFIFERCLSDFIFYFNFANPEGRKILNSAQKNFLG